MSGRGGALHVLARHRAVPWVLAGAFAAAGLLAVRANTFLNGEGVLTWIFAGQMSEWPVDGLFYLKIRPPLSAFWAPAAMLGRIPFLYLHTLLAAAAIPLTASLARHFGHRSPNLPALLVGLSPLYFAAAAAGVQNADALLALLVIVWLLVRGWPAAAGLLLTAMVLSRVEIAFFGAALAVWALLTPGARRFVVAAAALALLYVLAGALYHGDLLWPLHYPAFPTENPAVGAEARAHYGGDVKDLVTTVLGLTPVVGLALWASWRAMPRLEAVLGAAAVAFVFAIRVLPLTQLVYVDASPRYVLPALPYLCLLVARGVEPWGAGWGRTRPRALLLVAVTALLASPLADGVSRDLSWFGGSVALLLLATVGGCLVAVALAPLARRAAVGVLLTVAVAIGWALLPANHLYLGAQRRLLDESAAWLRSAPVPPGAPVVTDHHLLAIWMAEYVPERRFDVRHLITPDMLHDRNLANPATRQPEIMFGPSRFVYAPWISIEDLAAFPGEVFVVMRRDIHRTNLLTTPPFDRVEWLATGDDWQAGRLRPIEPRR